MVHIKYTNIMYIVIRMYLYKIIQIILIMCAAVCSPFIELLNTWYINSKEKMLSAIRFFMIETWKKKSSCIKLCGKINYFSTYPAYVFSKLITGHTHLSHEQQLKILVGMNARTSAEQKEKKIFRAVWVHIIYHLKPLN